MSRTIRVSDPEAKRLRIGLKALIRRFSISERADVSCCGMTVAQAATLQTLRSEGPLRLGALGRRLGIAPSTLTRNMSRLEAAGRVERIADPDDGRAYLVALTPDGQSAAAEVDRLDQEFAREILKHLPESRRRRALEGLADLIDAVREATEASCADTSNRELQNLRRDARQEAK